MKSINSCVKVLALVLAVVILGSIATISFAADSSVTTKNLKGAYGEIIPTDSKLKAQKKSYSFSGDSTTLYFWMISKGKSNAHCAVEIYSDSKRSESKLVTSYTNTLGKKGERALSVSWNFKSLHSGTYYGKSYIYKTSGDNKIIDSSTVNNFTVKIDRISAKTVSLSSISNGNGYVTINWKTIKTATKYIIYRKLSTDKSFSKLATVKEGVSSYKDKEVQSGKTYIYTVKAYDNGFTSKYDKTGLKILYLSRPSLNKITSVTVNGYAKLSWKKVTGAKGYYVYRKGGSLSSSEWEKIADVSSSTLSYTDKKATSTDWKYTYTVKAYNGKYKSTWNGTGVQYTHLNAPKLSSLSIASTGLTLKWKESNAATVKYYIYRKTSADGSWAKIGTATEKSYTDKTAKSGKTYYYTVKAVSSTNASAYNNTGLKSLFLSVPELSSLTVDKTGNMKISWKAVSGAKGYYVYKRVKGGDWKALEKIEGTKTLSYTDKTTKKEGTVYQYTVKAYNGKVSGKYNSNGLSGMFLAAPVTKLQNVEGGINISWNAVTGAKTYGVYKKAEGKSSWTCICKDLKETSFVDTDIVYNDKYSYMVKAFADSYESSYKSAVINAVSTPVLKDAVKTADGISITWEPVEGADTYYVYRKTPGGKWSLIGSYSQNEYVDTDKNALCEKYIYTVKAAIDNSTGLYDENGVSAYVETSNVTAEFTYIGDETPVPAIAVNWDACENNVSAYDIYRSADGEEGVLVKTTESAEETSYTDTDILQGVNYVYTVKPVSENKVACGTSSQAAKWPWPPVEAVEFTCNTVEQTEETPFGVLVKWTSVEFADSYAVMRKTAEGEWVTLENVVDANEYFDSTIEKDVEYFYTVKGVAPDRDSLYNEDGVKVILYSPLEGVTPSLELIDDEDVKGKKNILIKWENDENVEKYDLYRKAGDGEWEILTFELIPPAQMQFIDKNIEKDITYTYKVEITARGRTVNQHEDGNSIIWNSPVEAVEFTCNTVEQTEETPFGVLVKWTSVEFADSYAVMRKTAEGEWVTLENVVDANEYFDSTIEKDVEYFYTVKGVASDRDSLYNEDGVKVILYSPLEGVTPSLELVDDENDKDKKNILIKWENDENVEKYDLYRKAGDGEWEILTFELIPPAQMQFIDKNIEKDITYTYKVEITARGRTVNQHEDGNSIIWNSPVEAVEFTCNTVEQTEETPFGVLVKWTSVEFADSYAVMRKTAEGEWVTLENVVDANEYFDSTIEKDVEYFYTVKGVAPDRDSLYNEDGIKVILYSPLEGVTPSLELIDDEDVKGKKNILIKWENDENVEKYDLYRKAGDGEWEILTFELIPPAQMQFIDKNIEKDITYTYKVEITARGRAVNQHEDGNSIIWNSPVEPVEPVE